MRNRLARCAELTYAATTRAICSAIRKLARVTVGTAAGELSAKRVGEMAVARAVARTAIGAAVAKAGASEAAAEASSLLHSSLSMANAAAAAPIAIDPLSESAQCVRAATRLQAALRGHTARVAEGLKPERSAAVATARVRAKQTLTAFELRSFPPGSPSSSSLTPRLECSHLVFPQCSHLVFPQCSHSVPTVFPSPSHSGRHARQSRDANPPCALARRLGRTACRVLGARLGRDGRGHGAWCDLSSTATRAARPRFLLTATRAIFIPSSHPPSHPPTFPTRYS